MKSGNISPRSHVLMRLGDRVYACDMLPVQEIVRGPDLDPCFDGPELLIGMFSSARGPIPVLDLLGRPPDVCPIGEMALVVIEVSEHVICLVVDELLEVIDLDPSSVLPLPEGANGAPDRLLRGVVESSNYDYYLLDLDRIAATCLPARPSAGQGGREDGPGQ